MKRFFYQCTAGLTLFVLMAALLPPIQADHEGNPGNIHDDKGNGYGAGSPTTCSDKPIPFLPNLPRCTPEPTPPPPPPVIPQDTEPPRCAPAPTAQEYEEGTDYYTSNNLKNPWPPGLDGNWVTGDIEFYDNDPVLCRDQARTAKVPDCSAFGGELVDVDGSKICRFNQNSCPGGWTSYQNWSTTTSVPCRNRANACGAAARNATNDTGSHAWSNKARESRTIKLSHETGRGDCNYRGEKTCHANVTQIGCLPSGFESGYTTTIKARHRHRAKINEYTVTLPYKKEHLYVKAEKHCNAFRDDIFNTDIDWVTAEVGDGQRSGVSYRPDWNPASPPSGWHSLKNFTGSQRFNSPYGGNCTNEAWITLTLLGEGVPEPGPLYVERGFNSQVVPNTACVAEIKSYWNGDLLSGATQKIIVDPASDNLELALTSRYNGGWYNVGQEVYRSYFADDHYQYGYFLNEPNTQNVPTRSVNLSGEGYAELTQVGPNGVQMKITSDFQCGVDLSDASTVTLRSYWNDGEIGSARKTILARSSDTMSLAVYSAYNGGWRNVGKEVYRSYYKDDHYQYGYFLNQNSGEPSRKQTVDLTKNGTTTLSHYSGVNGVRMKMTAEVVVTPGVEITEESCIGPDGAPRFYYHEDYEDCLRLKNGEDAEQTLPVEEMSACFDGEGNRIVLDRHGVTRPFFMKDNEPNRTAERCPTPESKIDCQAPLADNLALEHAGLQLPKEAVGDTQSNANNFRADDGPLYLHADLTDSDPTAKCGESGLNWEPLVINSARNELQYDLSVKEQALLEAQGALEQAQTDLILARGGLLTNTATQINQLATNNLWAKTTRSVNDGTPSLFNTSLASLEDGRQTLQEQTFSETNFSQVISLLSRAKFNSVKGIDQRRQQLEDTNPGRVNQLLSTYDDNLAQRLNLATVNPLGNPQSPEAAFNEFQTAYNQWQIDKTKNYSHILPNWLASISQINNTATSLYNQYQNLSALNQTGNLLAMAKALPPIAGNDTLGTLLEATTTPTAEHVANQNQAVTTIESSNRTVDEVKTYLQNFDPNTDTFNPGQIKAAILALQNANDAVATLNADLDTEGGLLGVPLLAFNNAVNNGVMEEEIFANESRIRNTQAVIDRQQTELDSEEAQLASLQTTVTNLETEVFALRRQISELISEEGGSTTITQTVQTEEEIVTTITVAQQTASRCEEEGGTVMQDGGQTFCKFDKANCGEWQSSGWGGQWIDGDWKPFKNWQAADASKCGGRGNRGCTTSGRGFANNSALPTCRFYACGDNGKDGDGASGGFSCSPRTCTAAVSQVGCHLPGLTNQTTTTTLINTEEVEVQVFEEYKISHLEIERLNGDAKSEQFFPPTTKPESDGLFRWDLNLFRFDGETQPIFTVAGTYKVTLRAYDQAGNQSENVGFINILPAQLEVSLSSDCNSALKSQYADMQDTCQLTLPQFDRFGNKIQANKALTLSVRDQDTNGSYNLITEEGKNYPNGIRFAGGNFRGDKHVFEWQPAGADQKVVRLKSLLPTINVIPYEEDPRYAVGFEAANGFDLPLVLQHPAIGPRGESLSTPIEDVLDFQVKFKPWLQVALSDRSGPPSTSNWNVDVGDQFPVYVQATSGSAAKNLPSSFNVNLSGFIGDSFVLANEDLAPTGKTVSFSGVGTWNAQTGQTGMPATPLTTIETVSALAGQQTLEPLFIPTGAHQLNDGAAGNRTVFTPGLPLGFMPIPPIPENPPPDLTIADAATEEGQRLRFRVSLSSPAEENIQLFFNLTHNSTTTEDVQFNSSQAYTIPIGTSEVEVGITTTDDSVIESDETLTLSVASFNGRLNNSSDTGRGTIRDNDNKLNIFDVPVTEGDICQVGVNLHRPAAEDVTVTVDLGGAGDTATAGSDYTANTLSGTIPAGDSSILLEVPTLDDAYAEDEESFRINVVSVVGGNLTSYDVRSDCTIHDNDVQANVGIVSGSTVYEGDNVQMTITLDEPENEPVQLRLETFDLDGQAVSGASCTEGIDYVARIFDVTIPAGTLGVSAPASGIRSCDDRQREADEDFGVRVAEVLSGIVGDTSAVGVVTIVDDTPPIIPSIARISPEYGVERTPNDEIQFNILLDEANEGDESIIMTFELIDETASGGADYDNTDVTVTIPVGAQSGRTTSITILDDDVVEDAETFTIQHKSTDQGVMNETSITGTGTILDDDIPLPDVFIDDSTALEEDGTINFAVRLSAPHYDEAGRPLVLEFVPRPITATAGSDYIDTTYTATIPDGELSTNLAVELRNDAEVESAETFRLRFSNVTSGHGLGDTTDTAIGTILDGDTSAPSVIIDNANPVTEGGILRFNVRLSQAPASNATVNFLPYSGGTATAGSDYNANASSVTFTPTNYNQQVQVVTYQDNTSEGSETLTLKVSGTSGSSLQNINDIGIGVINDDDVDEPPVDEPPVDEPPVDEPPVDEPPVPSLILADADPVPEGTKVDFLVGLTHTAPADLRFSLRTKDGTAKRGSSQDFNAPGTIEVSFPAGTQAGVLIPVELSTGGGIPTIVDDKNEGEEYFTLEFAQIIDGQLDDTSATASATIMDSFNPPTIIIDDASATEGGRADFQVWLDRPDHYGVTVELEASGISAESPADFVCSADQTTVIFAPGDLGPHAVGCDIVSDEVNEPIETFALGIASVTGTVSAASDGQVGMGYINNRQVLDVVVEEPGIVMEDDETGFLQFTINLYDEGQPLIAAVHKALSLTFEPQDLLALGGSDFTLDGIDFRAGAFNTTLNPGKGAGSTTTTLELEINNDANVEINPDVLTSPENRRENLLMVPTVFSDTVRAASSSEGVIEDDDRFSCDSNSRVHIRDAQEIEGGQMVFDVALSNSLCDTDVELTFRTVDGSAQGATDFSSGTYTVTIPRLSKRPDRNDQLSIPTTNDTIVEGNENFQLEFVSASPASVITRVERKRYRPDGSLQDMGTVPVEGTILDNDTADPNAVSPDLIIENASALEGNNMDFVVRLSEPNPNATTRILFQATTDSFASAATIGSDFSPTIGAVSIAAGQGAGLATIITVDDALTESDESLLMGYLNLAAGILNDASDTGVGVIVDNDAASETPRVVLNDASALEGAAMEFTIGLENSLGGPMLAPEGGIQFVLDTLSGTATKGIDFGDGRTVSIPPNESQRRFSIETIEDTADEGDENFIVRITSTNKPTEVVDISDTALGTIVDDDSACTPDDFCCNFPSSCLAVGGRPGADIEGQVIVDESLCSGDACSSTDTQTVILGTTNVAKDIREEITRNAYDLIRGQEPDNLKAVSPKNDLGQDIIVRNDFPHPWNGNTIRRWDVYLNELPDGGVTYLDGQGNGYFRIGLRRTNGNFGTIDNPAQVSGRHTIIVVNGSLNIVGDMDYVSPDDSLGVIVMNTNIDSLQNLSRRGQLTIYKGVRHAVGAYYTDGSFVSNVWAEAGAGGGRINAGGGTPNRFGVMNTDPSDDWDVVNGSDANGNQLGRQLILTGNLLSKNTLGAADLVPPKGPWNEELEGLQGLLRAQMYDLNYIRRYVPEYDPVTLEHTNKNLCARLPGESECYNNEKSFVIRIDPRIKEIPPPGFSVRALTTTR